MKNVTQNSMLSSVLVPLLGKEPTALWADIEQANRRCGEEQVVGFIIQQGVAPLWSALLSKCGNSPFSAKSVNALREQRKTATIHYLGQKFSIQKISKILDQASIAHAFFKGAHIRELIYPVPADRPACDIDVLVSRHDKVNAVNALVGGGSSFHPLAKNISHEASLLDGGVSIDLHWDILRPGRTRIDLTDHFLSGVIHDQGHAVLNNEAALFIMLVHPVFTKYGTSPNATLVRLVDLHHWVNSQEIDWDLLFNWLDRGGVKTAAWITCQWFEMISQTSLPSSFVEKLRPSRIRAGYFQKWLTHNLSTWLFEHFTPLIQIGFTLPAHDTLTDALRALSTIRRERRDAEKNLKDGFGVSA